MQGNPQCSVKQEHELLDLTKLQLSNMDQSYLVFWTGESQASLEVLNSELEFRSEGICLKDVLDACEENLHRQRRMCSGCSCLFQLCLCREKKQMFVRGIRHSHTVASLLTCCVS